jgi:hypothetical protein
MSIAYENRELERGVSPVPVACHLGGPVAVVTMAPALQAAGSGLCGQLIATPQYLGAAKLIPKIDVFLDRGRCSCRPEPAGAAATSRECDRCRPQPQRSPRRQPQPCIY